MTPGPIQIQTGPFTSECTAQNDLIAASAAYPQIRDVVDYVNRRTMTTLITNGSLGPYGVNYNKKTRIPDVESKGSKGIGSLGYQFRIQGRIEKTAPILSQVGTSGADGTFTLKMLDTTLNKGDMPTFYGGRKVARVMQGPSPSAGGYLYTFATPNKEVFSYATWVAPQTGTKYCFAGWTTYGEQSLRGYGYSKFPDMFINHMTTQRQSISITGDANTQVLWVNFMGTNAQGNEVQMKGWLPQEVQQLKSKMSIQNERAKIFGVSDMKNADGTLAATPNLNDPETGRPITMGDGIEEQIAGGNVLYGSGTNGQPIISDYLNVMKTLQQKGDMVDGYSFLFMMGTVGFYNFQTECVAHLGNQNFTLMGSVDANGQAIGGPEVSAGVTFYRINFAGNTAYAAIHPAFDDPYFASETGNDGNSILSGTIFVLPLGPEANMNMEILHKYAFGVNRGYVEATLNGMTGAPEAVITQEDAKTYAVLKQDMICVYNTQICGIIYPNT